MKKLKAEQDATVKAVQEAERKKLLDALEGEVEEPEEPETTMPVDPAILQETQEVEVLCVDEKKGAFFMSGSEVKNYLYFHLCRDEFWACGKSLVKEVVKEVSLIEQATKEFQSRSREENRAGHLNQIKFLIPIRIWADAETWFERQQQGLEMKKLKAEQDATVKAAQEAERKKLLDALEGEVEEPEEPEVTMPFDPAIMQGTQEAESRTVYFSSGLSGTAGTSKVLGQYPEDSPVKEVVKEVSSIERNSKVSDSRFIEEKA
ncbi:hypothetical protein SELMODRAFT_408873 [Selaginella moellendorffii]|uniref:Uncharacterized protein n=1 Tax=Selaginella moellendorffii TaxID=88036 RepID=D8RA82_SELML|nr:hypothetical protein SELMODRAFT_408873 [Selaginella moellendorffii]